jgi:ABC-type branched-subunit amino acid transport system ATPase component/ABC-type branched-subunit amino acid transport system permease subunit
MNTGTFVLGLLNGLTIGLLAAGLVLVYKSSGFINLAQAQMGTVSALLVAKWVSSWGWNWWLSFVLAVLVGLVTGWIVERFLVRPLKNRRTSAVRLMFLTIGVSQLLLALTFVPSLGGNSSANNFAALPFPQPFTSNLQIGLVVLNGMSVLTMILVPTLVIGLTLFLRFSSLGQQIRAAASNPDAARLCGISVNRVSAITWGLAGSLAAVSAILAAPSQASFNAASFGPYLLFVTLGAAAFGAFVSLPWALVGGVVLGVISQVVTAETSDATKGELVVFLVILVVVLVRGRAIGRVFAFSSEAVEERRIIRVPSVLKQDFLTRNARWLALASVVALAVVLPFLPYFNGSGHQFLLVLILVYALIGIALTMLIGWAGQVSLGNFAVVGIAAYLTARLALDGWSIPALFILMAALGAAVMAIVGLPALRVPGMTLVVTTLGFAVVCQDWLFQQPWLVTGQPEGLTVVPPRLAIGLGSPSTQLTFYFVALVALGLAIRGGLALRRSSPGRLIIAVRDNERAASSFGVMPATVKLAVLALSGALVGVAGVLWADSWGYVTPAEFTANVSLALLAIPVIGGLGSIGGAVAAAVLLYGSTYFIGPLVTPVFGSIGQNMGFQLFLAGAASVGTLLAYPRGLAGFFQDTWQKFLDRRAGKPQFLQGQTTGNEVTGSAIEAVSYTSSKKASGPKSSGVAGLPIDGGGLEPAPPLVVSGVKVHFGGVTALDAVDVVVHAEEIVGLIGPNGAGKTTLMNVVSGFVKAESGSVQLFGNEVADLPADLRTAFGLSRSFQEAALFPGLTVKETVQVALARGHKIGILSAMISAPWARDSEARSSDRADDVIRRFGLTPWADTPTAELSTGTRRICDLAAQVAASPQLLLLDEPTGGIAQRDAEAFVPLLHRIRDDLGCSVMIVEHDMPLLMSLCDRVYAMDAGRILAVGSPSEIRQNQDVIASYLGTSEVAIARSGDSHRAEASQLTEATMRSGE